MNLITRRAALRGIATLSAAGGAGSALALGGDKSCGREDFRAETATRAALCYRARDLAAELSDVLTYLDEGNWLVEVIASWHGHPVFEFERRDLPAEAKVQKALRRAARALDAAQPGDWHTMYRPKHGTALIQNWAVTS